VGNVKAGLISNSFCDLGSFAFRVGFSVGVKVLITCAVLVQVTVLAEGAHDDDHDASVPVYNKSQKPPKGPSSTPESRCGVSTDSLRDFAEGEAYDFPTLVTFLTSPDCAEVGRFISSTTVADGVKFKSEGPFRLDNLAAKLQASDFDKFQRNDTGYAKTFANLLRDNPLTKNELKPLTGQLALVNPEAARIGLVNLIQQELYTADSVINSEAPPRIKQQAALELSQRLVRMGAGQNLIASGMAESVEEMALLAQADSLGKIFRALGAATAVEGSLASTFNLSAAAVDRGIQRGKKFYAKNDVEKLFKNLVAAVKAAVDGSEPLESGAVDLNEAMAALVDGNALQASALKSAYKEILKLLAQSSGQPALADAVAVSFTPQIIYLTPSEMKSLIAAARNYPSLAQSLQSNFLLAWQQLWEQVRTGQMSVVRYNGFKDRFIAPLVGEILALGPSVIDPRWLSEAWRAGLVKDTEIEKRFPRLMLAYLDRRDRALKARELAGLDSTVGLMAENFGVLYTLSNVHVPALLKWVKKYDQ
jgi:hypothetical protein